MTNIYLSFCIYNFDVAQMGNGIKQAAITWEVLCAHKVSICLPIAHSFTPAVQALINGS